MKLCRFGEKGAERPGLIDADGAVRDLSGVAADFAGAGVSLEALAALKSVDAASLPLAPEGARIGAALADVPNFHCVGLNYARHAAESGYPVPAEPVLFSKATSALSGPFDPVVLPRGSVKGDWEVELGVVIGRDTYDVSEAEALGCISAYCLVNDVSEREFQNERGGQWVKGKSSPTFAPTGPWLVTADEVGDPQTLDLWLKVNGEMLQNSNTSDMIFTVAHIVSYMSRFMALRTGDIIVTGTPEGVGMGFNPPRYLKAGDVIELGIEGLGTSRQDVQAR